MKKKKQKKEKRRKKKKHKHKQKNKKRKTEKKHKQENTVIRIIGQAPRYAEHRVRLVQCKDKDLPSCRRQASWVYVPDVEFVSFIMDNIWSGGVIDTSIAKTASSMPP